MKSPAILKKSDGFTLVQALFILIVLALLGAAMMRLLGVQSSTTVFTLQGARAYETARSGVEWGAGRALAGASCNGTMTIEGFNVITKCTSESFEEGSITTVVYQIASTATFGAYGSPDYISRRVEMKVGF